MRFYATINALKLNRNRYTKAIKTHIYGSFVRAAVKFMDAAAPAIPVDTGMARGTFLNLLALARNLGINSSASIPANPQRTRKDGSPLTYYHHDGSKRDKIPVEGARLSTPADKIIQFRGDKINMEFNTSVWHLDLNERFNTRVPGTPWHSFNRGREAFMRSLADLKDNMPRIEKYITVTTISGGRKSNFYEPFRERMQQSS